MLEFEHVRTSELLIITFGEADAGPLHRSAKVQAECSTLQECRLCSAKGQEACSTPEGYWHCSTRYQAARGTP